MSTIFFYMQNTYEIPLFSHSSYYHKTRCHKKFELNFKFNKTHKFIQQKSHYSTTCWPNFNITTTKSSITTRVKTNAKVLRALELLQKVSELLFKWNSSTFIKLLLEPLCLLPPELIPSSSSSTLSSLNIHCSKYLHTPSLYLKNN